MPRRSSIEMQGLVDLVINLFHNKKMTQAEIAAQLNSEGYQASTSSVGRSLQKHSDYLKELEAQTIEAQAIIAATKGTPGIDIAEAGLRIISKKLLDELKQIEDFGDIDSDKIVGAFVKTARASGFMAKVKLDYEKGYRAGLFKAAEELEDVLKEKGISEKTVIEIKSRVLGLCNG